MDINPRLLTFAFDKQRGSFVIKTNDPEYLKILLAEDPLPTEFVFELDTNTIRQMCKYFSLWSRNQTNIMPEEDLH